MGKWQFGILVVFLVIYAVLVLITGNVTWFWGVLGFAGLALLYTLLSLWIGRRALKAHGGNRDAAAADNLDPVPASHIIPYDDRPSGDTPEVHNEVNPHDFPLDSPARHTAAAQVGGHAHAETRGNVDGAQGGEVEAPVQDRTGERALEDEQGSAAGAR